MDPVKKDMELLSNSMATYAHIKANPESFALYFMMGVCFGLLMALCLMVAGFTCRPRRRPRGAAAPTERRRAKASRAKKQAGEAGTVRGDEEEEVEEEEDEEEEEEERDGSPKAMVDAAGEPGGRSNGTLRSVNVFASAEELEKARRLEERERIVREIWRNGQPDILVTGTGTIGRVHYH